MIHVGLLDTTVPGAPGSMARYRKQLQQAMGRDVDSTVRVSVRNIGCSSDTLRRTPTRLRMMRRHLEIWRAAKRLDASEFDVVHLLDGSFGYVVDAISCPRVAVTVHDVIPRLQMDGEFSGAPKVGMAARWLIQRSLDGVSRAQRIVSVSGSTRTDLARLGISDVEVVHHALETELFSGGDGMERQGAICCSLSGRSPSPGFLFHLGNNGFYKNRTGVVQVFDQIAPDCAADLVLAGPPPDPTLELLVAQSRYRNRIHFVNDPDQPGLNQLYRSAGAFVFPSRYEGFGWPPLEAMSCGCPVVCSNAGSLPEVVGDAGMIVPADNLSKLADACRKLLTDQRMRSELIQRGVRRAGQFRLRAAGRTNVRVLFRDD